MKKYKDMTADEKAAYFATGRCTAGLIEQLREGELVKFYLPRVRGHYVRLEGQAVRHDTPEGALQDARHFRDIMRNKHKELKP